MNIEASLPGEGFRLGELQAFLKELRSAVVELVPGGQLETASVMADSMNRVPDICTRIDCFGRGSLGGRGFGVVRRSLLFGRREHQRHSSHPDEPTSALMVGRGFLVGGGGDIVGSPVKPVSYFVSGKA
ncbi:unnamed protein product [Tuber aestivum]|uniref:Uncharacterized protein n=1 Tax=Tuber aestivum TaxID=59557 RepID=A0A292Q5A5_9PEZI|nr:unnamed protein product [Tuber aestivum]